MLPIGEIPVFTKELVKTLSGGEVFGLIGPLGSGKTTFVQELAKHLGVTRRVTSPTYTLLQEYSGKLPKNKNAITLYHIDIYRVPPSEVFPGIGLAEILRDKNGVVCIEWADLIRPLLPPHTTYISLHA